METNTTRELYQESYILSKDNLEINLDEWKPGNPLWITGTSGDGKSTLARQMADDKRGIVISTDYVLLRLTKTKEKLDSILARPSTASSLGSSEGVELSIEFINKHPEMPSGLGSGPNATTALSKYFKMFFTFLLDKAKTDSRIKDKYVVVEGCDITYMDIELAATLPLIIMGCSRLRAFIHRYKRERSATDNLGPFATIWKLVRKYTKYGKALDDEKEKFWDELEARSNLTKESMEFIEIDVPGNKSMEYDAKAFIRVAVANIETWEKSLERGKQGKPCNFKDVSKKIESIRKEMIDDEDGVLGNKHILYLDTTRCLNFINRDFYNLITVIEQFMAKQFSSGLAREETMKKTKKKIEDCEDEFASIRADKKDFRFSFLLDEFDEMIDLIKDLISPSKSSKSKNIFRILNELSTMLSNLGLQVDLTDDTEKQKMLTKQYIYSKELISKFVSLTKAVAGNVYGGLVTKVMGE